MVCIYGSFHWKSHCTTQDYLLETFIVPISISRLPLLFQLHWAFAGWLGD